MGMTPASGYHFKPTIRNDIIALANRHDMDDIFTFHPGRTQPFQAKDVFGLGNEKLGQTNLIKDFLARTIRSEDSVNPRQVDEDEDVGGGEVFELDDPILNEFESPNDLLQ